MISARQRLVGVAREFFEREIPGLFSWDRVAFDAAEPLERDRHGRRNPLGRDREFVRMRFGDYVLEVYSSEDNPPLGRVVLQYDGVARVSGPIDAAVWVQCGNFIKENGHGGRRRTG